MQTTGCRVTGLTISKEQLAEATARVKAAGLDDRVKLLFCDYRDCPGAGTFDKVVSIEMIEAVRKGCGLWVWIRTVSCLSWCWLTSVVSMSKYVTHSMPSPTSQVGHEHLVPYFSVIGKMLRPGGKAVLQAISVPDER